MRVLIHTDEYYPTCKACAYRMKVFADVFMSLGNEVTVISSSTNKRNRGIEGYRERVIFAPTIHMKKKTTLMRMINNLSFALTSVFASVKAGKVDVVLTTSPTPFIGASGWLIAKIKGAKLVFDVRDIWPEVALEMNSFSENSFFCKVFHCISNFMYKHADIITTVSPGKVAKIKGKLKSESQDKVRLIGNGFDESILDNDIDVEVLNRYGIDSKFTCVYIGNIGLAQGLDVILDLAAKTSHKDVQFLLFGVGAEKDKLERRSKEDGLTNVRFCGMLEHDKVFTVLSKVQMSFISLKNSNMKDSIPTKVYEALGIGCPVLLVAEGDACDIVNETGMGKCVSPNNIGELSAVFDQMVEHYNEIISKRQLSMQLIRDKYSRQKITVDFERQLRLINQ